MHDEKTDNQATLKTPALCKRSLRVPSAAHPETRAEAGPGETDLPPAPPLPEPVASLGPCPVVWTGSGICGLDSMPAGGGRIGLNVWTQDGEVLFYIGSPDSLTEGRLTDSLYGEKPHGEMLTKLGRVRLVISPHPAEAAITQQLELETNTVRVNFTQPGGQEVSLRIHADVHQPVVHVEGSATYPVGIKAVLELDTAWGMSATADDGGLLWSRRLPPVSAYREKLIRDFELEALRDLVPDTLGNLTCGGLLVATGFDSVPAEAGTHEGRPFTAAALQSNGAVESFHLLAALRIAQDATLADWRAAVLELAEHATGHTEEDRVISATWWRTFWNRSYIVIDPEHPGSEPWQVGRNYQLFRAMLGANSCGKFPTLFNGGFFTCGADPDARAWDYCRFMAQNQRLLYWPLLKSGDFDVLAAGLDFYVRTASLQAARLKEKQGVDGIVWDESLNSMGLGNFPSPDGFNALPHLRHHFTTGLEFTFMMLEAIRYSGTDPAPYLPSVEGTLHFFDRYYRRLNLERTGQELGDDGKLVLYPLNALELYQEARNAADVVAGLRALSDALLELPSHVVPSALRAFTARFRETLPALPVREMNGQLVLAPAESWSHEGTQANAELPQLYSVFPFGCHGVGRPELDLARDTWRHGYRDEAQKCAYCWYQGHIFTARLGLTNEARDYTLSKFLFPFPGGIAHNAWRNPIAPPRTRYPVFYDTPEAFCAIPDMDHGGSAMIGLQEMLLQAVGEKILLFPAWPPEWDVDFKLHAPGRTVVEGEFRQGRLQRLTVTPAARAADVVDLSAHRSEPDLALLSRPADPAKPPEPGT